MYNHVMLDIETLGDESNVVITSIGAVLFDPHHGAQLEEGSRFYATIDIQSSLNVGLKVTASTLKWWLYNDPATLRRMLEDAQPLQKVLLDFTSWINQHGDSNLYIWGRSPRFDAGKMQDAYNACCLKIPWDFRKEMDVRTLMALTPTIWETTPARNPHDPIADALKQIEAVCRSYSVLGLRPIEKTI